MPSEWVLIEIRFNNRFCVALYSFHFAYCTTTTAFHEQAFNCLMWLHDLCPKATDATRCHFETIIAALRHYSCLYGCIDVCFCPCACSWITCSFVCTVAVWGGGMGAEGFLPTAARLFFYFFPCVLHCETPWYIAVRKRGFGCCTANRYRVQT